MSHGLPAATNHHHERSENSMCPRFLIPIFLLLPAMALAQAPATRPATAPSEASALLTRQLDWSNLESTPDTARRFDPITPRLSASTLGKVDLKQEARDLKRQAVRRLSGDSKRDRTSLVRPLEVDLPERLRLPEGRRHTAPPPGIGPFTLPIPPSRFRFLPGMPMPAISTPLIADEQGSVQFPLMQPFARPLGFDGLGLEDDEELDFSDDPPVVPDDDLPMREDNMPPKPLLPDL